MKKLISLMAGVLVATVFLFVSCQDKPETDVPPQEEKPVAVTGVSLDKTTAEIKVGDVLRLTATVKPDKAADPSVSWASDAPEIASVDELGVVRGHKAGSAKITVTTTDGGKTASCTVTVKEAFTLRYYSPDATEGYSAARDAEEEMTESIFFNGSYRAVFFLSADGAAPFADKDSYRYTITDLKAPEGVIADKEMIKVQELGGVECVLYTLEFLAPGTAEFTLNYKSGAKSFSKTVKFTVEDKPHDIGFVIGVANAVLANGKGLYKGPTLIGDAVLNGNFVWVCAWDKSTNKRVEAGSFSLDPDLDGDSSALYGASVLEWVPGLECIRIKFNTRGYINIGVRFEGEDGRKVSACLCFYTITGLTVWTSKTQQVSNNTEVKVMEGETLSLAFHNDDRNRDVEIVADSLKITGGNASIATLERAADGKSLTLKGIKEGSTSWTIDYSYFGMKVFPAPTTFKTTVTGTVPVTAVKILNPATTINVGEKRKETVQITPSNATDQTVVWEAYNTSVARIVQSDGLSAYIEGVSPGKTNITARCGDISDTYVVSVKANYEIRYNGSAVSGTLLYKPGSALSNILPFTFYNKTTSASVNPVDAKYTTVYSSDESVAKFHSISQDKIYVQALSTGSTKLTFYVGGQSVGSFTLTVLPSPEVHSMLTGKAVASTEYYVLGYMANNLVRFEMFDLFTNKYYNPTSGLNVVSTNPTVAIAVVDTYSGHQVWYVQAVQAGSTVISFLYNGEVVKQITYTVRNDRAKVDLGLSVKWATMNIGASQPYEPGELFAWGETQGKTDYSWSTYKWGSSISSLTKYTYRDGIGTLQADDDVAQVRWGWGWRMPTNAECAELCTKCTWTETTLSGIKVFKITGTNGNSIYLPIAGYYSGTSLRLYGTSAVYWTSERLGGTDDAAKTMVANKGSSRGSTGQTSPRWEGLYVRAVKK